MIAWYSRARSSLSSSINRSRVMVSALSTNDPPCSSDSMCGLAGCSWGGRRFLWMQVPWPPAPPAALAAGWRGPHPLHGHEEVMRLVEQEELEPERNRHRPQHGVDAAPREIGRRDRRDGRHQL